LYCNQLGHPFLEDIGCPIRKARDPGRCRMTGKGMFRTQAFGTRQLQQLWQMPLGAGGGGQIGRGGGQIGLPTGDHVQRLGKSAP
jgi:hypothetical protein